jgi:homoserine kinase
VSGTARAGWTAAFAPATIANFGSGFDAFAAAVCSVEPRRGAGERLAPLGDVVRVRRTKQPGVRVTAILGDGGRLPRSAARNCAAAAAAAVLRRTRARFGLELVIEKGLPLASGLGSSAASAAAGAFAASLVSERELTKRDLIDPSLAGEHIADGSWHGDNVWASLFGGGVVVVTTRPPELVPLPAPRGLRLVAVHPECELPTRRARAVLPRAVPLGEATSQAGRFGALVAAWPRGDRERIGRSLHDAFAAPRRASLVPGYREAREAALAAGAFGFAFAGAGPSVLAVTPSGEEQSVGEAIRKAFRRKGLGSSLLVCAIDPRGARRAR